MQWQCSAGAGVGGQRVGGGGEFKLFVERNEEDEEAGGVRPAEAGREYQVNTLTLTFTFRRTINVETIG